MHEPLRRVAAAILILLLVVSAGSAQTATGGQAREPHTDIVSGAFSTPEDPALALLGVTPQAIFRPSSPNALGTYLNNGIDENGNLKTGLAVQTAPYFLLRGADITLEKYNSDWFERVLSNIQLSLATTKGASEEDMSVSGAIGLRLVIFDWGDPRLFNKNLPPSVRTVKDLPTCFGDVFPESALPSISETLPSETGVKLLPDEKIAACKNVSIDTRKRRGMPLRGISALPPLGRAQMVA